MRTFDMVSVQPRFEIDLERQICRVALPSTSTSWHALWGVTVAVGLESPIEIEDANGTVRGRIIVVPARHIHRRTSRGPFASVFLDGDAHRATRIASARDRCFVIEGGTAAVSSPESLFELVERTFPTGPGQGIHPFVAAMVSAAARGENVRLDQMATRRGLSSSRLSELLSANMGIPFREWTRWRRLLAALPLLERGRLASAATHAGFADQAHLSRTCRSLLGVAPSKIAALAAATA